MDSARPRPPADASPPSGAAPDGAPDASGNAIASPTPIAVVTPAQRWVARIGLFIFVSFCIEVGMVLVALPWTDLWTNNPIVLAHLGWRDVLQNHFLRGAVSGLGLVDIWMGISEAVHYRETPR
jgi:hypothetical protein